MFHLTLEGPFIFCNIMHCYKRDHIHMVAKFLSHQHSLDKLSGTCVSQNTRSLWIEGNPASQELGCLGTVCVKPIYPSQKILQQTWQGSHENLILQGQDSANIKVGNCFTCKTNRGKLAFWDKLWKKDEILLLRRLKAHCTLVSTVLPRYPN